jgi:hypothetical protein
MFYLWYALVAGIFSIAILPTSSTIYPLVAAFDANRWLHFLAYALVTVIPVALGRGQSRILVSFFAVATCVAVELLRSHIPALPHVDQAAADMFGVAAGILLGLNLRVMRHSARTMNEARLDSSKELTQ